MFGAKRRSRTCSSATSRCPTRTAISLSARLRGRDPEQGGTDPRRRPHRLRSRRGPPARPCRRLSVPSRQARRAVRPRPGDRFTGLRPRTTCRARRQARARRRSPRHAAALGLIEFRSHLTRLPNDVSTSEGIGPAVRRRSRPCHKALAADRSHRARSRIDCNAAKLPAA